MAFPVRGEASGPRSVSRWLSARPAYRYSLNPGTEYNYKARAPLSEKLPCFGISRRSELPSPGARCLFLS